MLRPVAIPWKKTQRRAVEDGLKKHPISSGRCAALARIIQRVAVATDPDTHGIQLCPRGAARYLVPKHPHVPLWRSHTLVTTHQHNIDAITGAPGHAAREYLEYYWEYHEVIDVQRVDVNVIDPGIEGDDS